MLAYLRRFYHAAKHKWRHRSIPILSSQNAYALWAQDYPPIAHNQLMQVEQDAMLMLCPSLAGMRVLDVGAGSGRYTQFAQAQSADTVFSLDDSVAMLQQNTASYRIQASANELPLPSACADVILCGLMIGHLLNVMSLFTEFSRVLDDGGILLVSDVHPVLASDGALRTFNHAGKIFAVEHYVHAITDIKHIAQAHNLRCDALHESQLEKEGQTISVAVIYRFQKIRQ